MWLLIPGPGTSSRLSTWVCECVIHRPCSVDVGYHCIHQLFHYAFGRIGSMTTDCDVHYTTPPLDRDQCTYHVCISMHVTMAWFNRRTWLRTLCTRYAPTPQPDIPLTSKDNQWYYPPTALMLFSIHSQPLKHLRTCNNWVSFDRLVAVKQLKLHHLHHHCTCSIHARFGGDRGDRGDRWYHWPARDGLDVSHPIITVSSAETQVRIIPNKLCLVRHLRHFSCCVILRDPRWSNRWYDT